MKPRFQRFHFVGIGGIGMAALAELLHARGFAVTGTDLVAGATVERLRRLGIRVERGPRRRAASAAPTSSSARRRSRTTNPELRRGRERAAPDRRPRRAARRAAAQAGRRRDRRLPRQDDDDRDDRPSAARGGLDPTAVVGGRVPSTGGDAGPLRLGRGEWAVAEVDESDGSFLAVRPVVAVVTNADPEHLDYYGTRERLLDAFVAFANGVPFYGRRDPRHRPPGRDEIAPAHRRRARSTSASRRTRTSAPSRSRPARAAQRCQVRLAERRPLRLRARAARPPQRAERARRARRRPRARRPRQAAGRGASRAFPASRRRFETQGRRAPASRSSTTTPTTPPRSAPPSPPRAASIPGRSTAIFQPHRYTRTRDCWTSSRPPSPTPTACVSATSMPRARPDPRRSTPRALPRDRRAAATARAVYGGDLQAIERRLAASASSPGELVMTLGAGDIVGPRPEAAARTPRASRPGVGRMIDSRRARGPRGDVSPTASSSTCRSPVIRRCASAARPMRWRHRPIGTSSLACSPLCAEHALPDHWSSAAGSTCSCCEGGMRGVVAAAAQAPRIERVADDLISVEAGASHATITRFCVDHGLAGLEFGAGIPGTLGGWIAMNAGIGVREMKDVVREIEVLDRRGADDRADPARGARLPLPRARRARAGQRDRRRAARGRGPERAREGRGRGRSPARTAPRDAADRSADRAARSSGIRPATTPVASSKRPD